MSVVLWCEHCRDHFDRKHYGEDGHHIVGAGPFGELLSELTRLRTALKRIADHPVDDPQCDHDCTEGIVRAAQRALQGWEE